MCPFGEEGAEVETSGNVFVLFAARREMPAGPALLLHRAGLPTISFSELSRDYYRPVAVKHFLIIRVARK